MNERARDQYISDHVPQQIHVSLAGVLSDCYENLGKWCVEKRNAAIPLICLLAMNQNQRLELRRFPSVSYAIIEMRST